MATHISCLITDITKDSYPPFEEDVILYTDRGKVMGHLKSININGFEWVFNTDNFTHWVGAVPYAFMVIPKYEHA